MIRILKSRKSSSLAERIQEPISRLRYLGMCTPFFLMLRRKWIINHFTVLPAYHKQEVANDSRGLFVNSDR